MDFKLLNKKREIELEEKKFKRFENTITSIEDLVVWLKETEDLYKSVKYKTLEHHFISSFVAIYNSVTNIKLLMDCSSLAKKAITEFNKIDISTKGEIKDWLNKYRENDLLIPFGYNETSNWEKTKLILFKNSPDIFNENHTIFDNIIIDITNYESSIKFRNIYEQHSNILNEI